MKAQNKIYFKLRFKIKTKALVSVKGFPSKKLFVHFQRILRPDYKFLQKAVDSYYVALYNPKFEFVQYFKNWFTNAFSALNLIYV